MSDGDFDAHVTKSLRSEQSPSKRVFNSIIVPVPVLGQSFNEDTDFSKISIDDASSTPASENLELSALGDASAPAASRKHDADRQ